MTTSLRTTVFDILKWRKAPSVISRPAIPSHLREHDQTDIGNHLTTEANIEPQLEEINDLGNEEFKLPKLASLVIVIVTNALLQVSFFVIVSSSNLYAEHLGGGSTFAGVVIGIPTVFSGIALLPLMKLDKRSYKRPLHVACFTSVLGHIIYALAYKANFLYLILIGRIISGFSFTFFMYSKRYCSDPRLVGVRRRTTLAGWLVVGQGIGFSLGPFLGGVLYKAIGFGQDGEKVIFNGFTSPGWIMAGIWLLFWAIVSVFFEDVDSTLSRPSVISPAPPGLQDIELHNRVSPGDQESGDQGRQVVPEPSTLESYSERHRLLPEQWGVIVTMCWFAMTCFFILGAWESNIPVFTASAISSLHYSPFDAGNLIALGGVTIIPFLFMNLYFGPRIQDRITLAVGSSLGSIGLIVLFAFLAISPERVNFATLFISWALVAFGFNLASTCTLSLLSKQFPGEWNAILSLVIQYSNYTGRVTGAVWGGSGVIVGMKGYVGVEIMFVGIGALLFSTLWKNLKAKTG